MQNIKTESERRTTTEHVFASLQEDILSLKLLPGTKISEAEVAARFGVSRQPVRDAFNRLGNLDLLMIRPQRATVVRGFSSEKIAEARFLRLAAEMEVIHIACQTWDDASTEKTMQNVEQQVSAVEEEKWERFHALDFQFHLLLSELAGCPHAINAIKSCRQKTDRLCVLSFSKPRESESVIADHRQLIVALDKRDEAAASEVLRAHLGRLDSVVEEIREAHAEYFE